MKNWKIMHTGDQKETTIETIVEQLLMNRSIILPKDKKEFLHPDDPVLLTHKDVGIDAGQLHTAIARIRKAIEKQESIVVYADYDADGITAGAVMWEALYALGARVMPYVPHRIEEGYGLSEKGIQTIVQEFDPTLIITVDHGITAREQVEYAKGLGIDVIITDHHLPPKQVPDCTIVHTTDLCGAGVSFFVANMLLGHDHGTLVHDLLALTAIGTIADMVPLVGPNRAIAKFGLMEINKTKRMGLRALMKESGLTEKTVTATDISHIIAPRLNAMGRLEHAIDALRLLCTRNEERADMLAGKLGLTNKERQQLTVDTTTHALTGLRNQQDVEKKKILIVSDTTYNPGIIGLVAGKLVEQYYRPSIVIAEGEIFSKASARSIPGFNIVEFIRGAGDLLVDVGGHPMAAGFTVETKRLDELKAFFESQATTAITDDLLTRVLNVDMELPVSLISEALWKALQSFAPFGLGNYEPVFVTNGMMIENVRRIGLKNNHLKLKLSDRSNKRTMDAVGFGLGDLFEDLHPGNAIDVAYTIDENVWNGTKTIQLKLKDIHIQ